MCLVVMIHGGGGILAIAGDTAPLGSTIVTLLVQISRIAVPLFYIVSGYLFCKTTILTLQDYRCKLQKRLKTLILPYLIWNMLVAIAYYLMSVLAPSLLGGRICFENFSLLDFLRIFWDGNDGYPYNNPFWFIRNLLVVILFTPIIYKLLNWCKNAFVCVVLGCYIVTRIFWRELDLWDLVPAFTFFSLGAYFRLSKLNVASINISSCAGLFTASLIVGLSYFGICNTPYFSALAEILEILSAIVLLPAVEYKCVIKGCCMPDIIVKSNFFIYAYHSLFISALIKATAKVIPVSDFSVVAIAILSVITTILFGAYIYRIIEGTSIQRILTGAR